MKKRVQPSPNMRNTIKSCWPPWRKENYVGMDTWQEPNAYRRPSSEVPFKVEEEGAGRERNGRTTSLSRCGRALPRPKPLPMTVRDGDSWCSVHQSSAPTTPGRVIGFVIVMYVRISMYVCTRARSRMPACVPACVHVCVCVCVCVFAFFLSLYCNV